MKYLVKTPAFFSWLFPSCTWKIANNKNIVFLSFDDGPTPEITYRTLSILKKENIKATFFCIGNNIKKNPEIYNKILSEGHSVGNHTYDHPNGWKINNEQYFKSVADCNKLVNSKLFRPPYGRLKLSQINHLKKHYHIIMWDVIGGDFDHKKSVTDVVNNIVLNSRSGSIIVLHDSIRFGDKMLAALPVIIYQLKKKGFSFSAIHHSIQ